MGTTVVTTMFTFVPVSVGMGTVRGWGWCGGCVQVGSCGYRVRMVMGWGRLCVRVYVYVYDTTVPMTMCTRSYLRRQWWGSFTKSVMLGSLTTPTSVPYKVREVVSSKD